MVVKAHLYQALKQGECICRTCLRYCRIKDGERGLCSTRENRGGAVYSLCYGQVATLAVAEAERKPLFHFMPGKTFLSVGTLGCNFRCPGCQNWEIAHSMVSEEEIEETRYIAPEELVRLAEEKGCVGLSFTYNEPTVWFEYTLHASKIGKERGLLTNYVTNGSMTPEALDEIGPYLDAFRVDVKGYWPNTYRQVANFGRASELRQVAERAKERWGMHVECVSNIIPGLNDSEEEMSLVARWMAEKLGRETPWHVTRFAPHLDLAGLPPTPLNKLEKIREVGIQEGLSYVYIGNVPGHPGENTYCPQCGNVVIDRTGFASPLVRLEGNLCPRCGREIEGRFEV